MPKHSSPHSPLAPCSLPLSCATYSRMKPCRVLICSLLLTIPVWLLFSWPLPKHFAGGIPSAAENREKDGVRYMIQGDHLQLLYHFWLAQDMISGKTPFFYNVYEFNQGDDEACYAPGSYYAPFSLPFAAISLSFGRAAGWNATQFIALWFTVFFTWLLARRYSDSDLFSAAAATASILLPFRWVALFGGSPTGFAMVFVPVTLLGLDLAIRTDTIKGGFLAGTALLMACFSDSHTFYFLMLVTPAWCVVAFVRRDIFEWRNLHNYVRLAVSLSPTAILGLAGFLYRALRSRRLAHTAMAGGRRVSEVALNSPAWQGLWSFDDLGHTNHIFLGYTLTILIALGGLLSLLMSSRKEGTTGLRRRFAFLLIFLGLLGIISLAMGTCGPMEGKALHLCRKYLPKYTMIRQSTKVYALLPPLLAVALAVAMNTMRNAASPRNRGTATALVLLVCACSVVEFKSHVHATVSLIAKEQSAYEAVAESGDKPHALVIPLWPGDSAWTALYQHYASLYRIRMVNGYSPVVKRKYRTEVFDRFGSCNKGTITREQLQELQSMGINHIILHEDAFPEKVSPFPVGFTLKNLLNHPRLQLLKQSGPVWAFRITAEPRDVQPVAADWNVFFPARRYEFEWSKGEHSVTKTKEGVSGKGFLSLAEPGEAVVTKGTHTCPAPGLKWLLRAGGKGVLTVNHVFDGVPSKSSTLPLGAAEWQWYELPLPGLTNYAQAAVALTFLNGEQVDLDSAMLTAGKWRVPSPGESLVLPAALFFHAGSTILKNSSVLLRPMRDHAAFTWQDAESLAKPGGDKGAVFYGPRLPLPPGAYRVELEFDSPAEQGTTLGGFYAKQGRDILGFECVKAGVGAWIDITIPHELPLSVKFLYSGKADITLESVVFLRRQTGEPTEGNEINENAAN